MTNEKKNNGYIINHDEQTITITVKEANADTLSNLGSFVILPKHIWESVDDPNSYTGEGYLTGSGAYACTAYDGATGSYEFTAFDGWCNGEQAAEKSDIEAQIQEQIAQMYVLRSTYVSKLEAIAQAAIDEYVNGEHTEENRANVVYKRLEELTALEKECDAQVAQVVERLRSLLKQAGKDDSLAKQVEKTYQEEKSLKKAAYLEEFRNG